MRIIYIGIKSQEERVSLSLTSEEEKYRKIPNLVRGKGVLIIDSLEFCVFTLL